MHAAEIRRAVDAAPRSNLPEIAALLWQAFAAGHVDEAQAEELHAAIEARQVLPRSGGNLTAGQVLRLPNQRSANAPIEGISSPPVEEQAKPDSSRFTQDRAESPRSRVGSRPRSEASLARRRRWAASGRLPPAIACRFTLAEQAVLSVVAVETVKRGDCRLAIGHIAALAGVSETSVRNALREARRHGLVTVEERRSSAWRNLPNVVRILALEWTAWLRLAKGTHRTRTLSTQTGAQQGGCKSPNCTDTQVSGKGRPAPRKPSRQSRFRPDEERRAM